MPGQDKRKEELSLKEQKLLAPALRHLMFHSGLFNRAVLEEPTDHNSNGVLTRVISSHVRDIPATRRASDEVALWSEYQNPLEDMIYARAYTAMVDIINETNAEPSLPPLKVAIYHPASTVTNKGQETNTPPMVITNAVKSDKPMKVILSGDHYQFYPQAKEGPTGKTTPAENNCSFASLLQLLKYDDKQRYLLPLIEQAKKSDFSHEGFAALEDFANGRDITFKQTAVVEVPTKKSLGRVLSAYAKEYALHESGDKKTDETAYKKTVESCMKAVGEFDADKPLSTGDMALFVQQQAKRLREFEKQNERTSGDSSSPAL